VTNWRVFDSDQHIIKFLHLEGNFKDSIIDEGQHDLEMMTNIPSSKNQIIEKNRSNLMTNIPKSVVRLEKLYDI
jgi:hypothetical protein